MAIATTVSERPAVLPAGPKLVAGLLQGLGECCGDHRKMARSRFSDLKAEEHREIFGSAAVYDKYNFLH
jgi:hypothetical protein